MTTQQLLIFEDESSMCII